MNKEKRIILLLDGALVVFALIAKYLAGFMLDALPDCVYARYGIPCPSCGGTRCVRYFFSGSFRAAFAMHPFLFLVILYLMVALVLANVGILLHKSRCRTIGLAMVNHRAVIALSIGYVIFGILRAVYGLL